MLLGTQRLLALQLLAFVSNLASLLLGRQYVELVTGLRCTVQTKNEAGFTRQGFLYLLTALIEHSLDLTMIGTRQHDIALMQSTVAHQHGGHIAASFIQTRLDD